MLKQAQVKQIFSVRKFKMNWWKERTAIQVYHEHQAHKFGVKNMITFTDMRILLFYEYHMYVK